MLELGCWVELIESRAGSWVEEVGMVTDFPVICKKRNRDILMSAFLRAQNIVT